MFVFSFLLFLLPLLLYLPLSSLTSLLPSPPSPSPPSSLLPLLLHFPLSSLTSLLPLLLHFPFSSLTSLLPFPPSPLPPPHYSLLTIGYLEGTFDLVWRKQTTDGPGEEEVALEWKSSATLHEMGMPSEPAKSYLLIRERQDGTAPQRAQQVTVNVIVTSQGSMNVLPPSLPQSTLYSPCDKFS